MTVAELEALLEGTTPGPWATVEASNGVAVCGKTWVSVQSSPANARLIAAAPDLAAALVAALAERPAGRGGYPKRYVEGLQADLAAALGERDELRAEVERLAALCGRHDPTGADHMEEMIVHADRADFLAAHPVAPQEPTP